MTGDARGDHVLAGLGEAGLLDRDGRHAVSVMKVPHHGSYRNIDADYLRALPAEVYVVSADGRYGNPDPETLALIVETAHEDGRSIELVMTNVTPAGERLLETHAPAKFGYQMRVLPPGESVFAVDARPLPARAGAAWRS
jgi:hypothetical protein